MGELLQPKWFKVSGLAVVFVLVCGVVVFVVYRNVTTMENPDEAYAIARTVDIVSYDEGFVSVHGDDFAYDADNAHRIVVCDVEADDNPVKVIYEFEDGSKDELHDLSERGECTALDLEGRILRHRVCERNHIRWVCHNWKATD